MKGILFKSELYDGWLVRWSDPREYREPIHEIALHPDDVEVIIDESEVSDNIEKFYDNLEVEFEIVENQKLSGVSRYAKIKN